MYAGRRGRYVQEREGQANMTMQVLECPKVRDAGTGLPLSMARVAHALCRVLWKQACCAGPGGW